MASLLNKIAQCLLILFCLTHTRIHCAEWIARNATVGSFAIIKAAKASTNSGPTSCAGIWTDKDFILTAASCLDEDGKLRWTVNGTIDVLVWQMVRTARGTYYWNQEKNGAFKGKAIFHPNYKRVDGPTIYDVAWVKAFGPKEKKTHKNMKPCRTQDLYSGMIGRSGMIAIGRISNNVTEWNLKQTTDKNIATVNNLTDGKGLSNLSIQGRAYNIDLSKQFTARLSISDRRKKEGTTGPFSETIFSKEGLGGPILYQDTETTYRCLGGIMTSKGVKSNELYITATISYPQSKLDKFFRVAVELLNAAEKGSK